MISADQIAGNSVSVVWDEADAALRIFAPGGAITSMVIDTKEHATFRQNPGIEVVFPWALELFDCFMKLAHKHDLQVFHA